MARSKWSVVCCYPELFYGFYFFDIAIKKDFLKIFQKIIAHNKDKNFITGSKNFLLLYFFHTEKISLQPSGETLSKILHILQEKSVFYNKITGPFDQIDEIWFD